MVEAVTKDLSEGVETLAKYVEEGFSTERPQQRREHVITGKIDSSKFKPIEKLPSHDAKFAAVDCSTRTLKRANNWGIYLFRVAYAMVERREVDWDYREKVKVLLGSSNVRYRMMRIFRLEVESELALSLTGRLNSSDYLLLDGASYFGEKTGFSTSLYEQCKRKTVNLLAFSKQSPTLHDELGRDFQATAQLVAPHPLWVYHPVTEADLKEHLYGDVSLVKLCKESLRVFRCDIMKYLINRDVAGVVSPLTAVSEDPRCLGYPVPLRLAHEFSSTSDSKLLYYYERVESLLKEAGIYDRLRKEELACSFADELHGIRYPFERELFEYV